jgi:hypothetical protein
MTPLAKLTIDAHGGLDRWNQFDAVSADLVQGGVLWKLKGQARDPGRHHGHSRAPRGMGLAFHVRRDRPQDQV